MGMGFSCLFCRIELCLGDIDIDLQSGRRCFPSGAMLKLVLSRLGRVGMNSRDFFNQVKTVILGREALGEIHRSIDTPRKSKAKPSRNSYKTGYSEVKAMLKELNRSLKKQKRLNI